MNREAGLVTPNRRKASKTAVLLGAGASLLLGACGTPHDSNPETIVECDATAGNVECDTTVGRNTTDNVECRVVGDHTVTVQEGQGVDALIADIPGSGYGDGDVCWDDADRIIRGQTGDIPQSGQQIHVPDKLVAPKSS